MNGPDIAVLTIAKGRQGHLANLIDGLCGGVEFPTSCIVIDMNDEPASLPATPFPLLHHHAPMNGLPLAEARNQAARLAGDAHLVFLDVDCIPAPGFVPVMRQALDAHDALVCCEVLYLPPNAAGGAAGMEQSGRPHPHRPFPTRGSRLESNAGLFWSLAFGIRAATFQALGGFDTRFSGYGAEDTDLGFRARAAGVPLVLTAETRAFHQYHPVFDPPLQHFDDILANAGLFRDLHGIWPMDGWLCAFAAMGLIEWSPDGPLRCLRRPTSAEVAAAACPPERAF